LPAEPPSNAVAEKSEAGVRKDHNLPQQQIIGRPFCEVCKAQMWLACIEPDEPDYDKRTFEFARM
jgi:hypothetical protein